MSRGPSFAQIVAVVNRPIETLSDEELATLKCYHEKNKECAESWLAQIEDEQRGREMKRARPCKTCQYSAIDGRPCFHKAHQRRDPKTQEWYPATASGRCEIRERLESAGGEVEERRRR